MQGENAEIEYYRSVEDLFSSLRGTPHVLSPRDFQLLRSWWRDGVPIAAISAGLTEVFSRQQERGDADPVVSLSYCRHAVKRHTKRLAAMHTGQAETGDDSPSTDAGGTCDRLVAELTSAAETHRTDRPVVAEVLLRTASQVEIAATELSIGMLEEHLFELETAMLHDCFQAMPEGERRTIDSQNQKAAEGSSATEEARQRTLRALRDREIRRLLGLPRLEPVP